MEYRDRGYRGYSVVELELMATFIENTVHFGRTKFLSQSRSLRVISFYTTDVRFFSYALAMTLILSKILNKLKTILNT